MPYITLTYTLTNVAQRQASRLVQGLLNTHPGFQPGGVCPHIRSTLPLLKARSNDIFLYLKGFVGSAHGCHSMVCMTSTQFTKMTNRPSADFTVHVYPLHFMFWTHQNLWGGKKRKEKKQYTCTSTNGGSQQTIKTPNQSKAACDFISEFFIASLSSTLCQRQ